MRRSSAKHPPTTPPSDRQTLELRSVGLAEDADGLLYRAAGSGEALLVDRELRATGVDRLAQALHAEVGQLLGDRLQPAPDVVELTRGRKSTRLNSSH